MDARIEFRDGQTIKKWRSRHSRCQPAATDFIYLGQCRRTSVAALAVKYSFGSVIRSRQLCIGIDLFLGPFGRAGFSRIDSLGGRELLRRIRGVWT
jgi:hypothetical protein